MTVEPKGRWHDDWTDLVLLLIVEKAEELALDNDRWDIHKHLNQLRRVLDEEMREHIDEDDIPDHFDEDEDW